MKKAILTTAIFLFSLTVVSAQATKLGALIGPNLSTFPQSDGSLVTSSSVLGIHLGVFTEFAFGRLSIEPGLFYAVIGGTANSVDTEGAGGSSTDTYSLQYLQVPLNFLYNTPDRKFFFGGGPYIGFGLSGHETDNISDGSFFGGPPSMETIDKKFIFNGTNNPDYGFNILAGVHLTGGTIFTVSYALGRKYEGGFYSSEGNNVFGISIGHTIL